MFPSIWFRQQLLQILLVLTHLWMQSFFSLVGYFHYVSSVTKSPIVSINSVIMFMIWIGIVIHPKYEIIFRWSFWSAKDQFTFKDTWISIVRWTFSKRFHSYPENIPSLHVLIYDLIFKLFFQIMNKSYSAFMLFRKFNN